MQNSKQAALVERVRRFFPQVNRVAFATKPISVAVKECDITGAKKKAEDDCAMAHAVVRQHKADGAIIRPTVAYVVKGDLAVKYEVPQSVAREIVSFDRNHDFREGTYQLSAVCPCHRSVRGGGAKKKATFRRTRKYTKPLVSHVSAGMRGVKPQY